MSPFWDDMFINSEDMVSMNDTKWFKRAILSCTLFQPRNGSVWKFAPGSRFRLYQIISRAPLKLLVLAPTEFGDGAIRRITKNFWNTYRGKAPASTPVRKARQKIFERERSEAQKLNFAPECSQLRPCSSCSVRLRNGLKGALLPHFCLQAGEKVLAPSFRCWLSKKWLFWAHSFGSGSQSLVLPHKGVDFGVLTS